MALSFATTIELGVALGTVVPILSRHPEVLRTPQRKVLVAGVFLMVIGVIVCSWAGQRREKEQKGQTVDSNSGSFVSGILMAAAAGLLSPMLNYALAFGDSLVLAAIHHHTTRPDAPYAVWPIALAGGGSATESGLRRLAGLSQQELGQFHSPMAAGSFGNHHGCSVDGLGCFLRDRFDFARGPGRFDWVEYLSNFHDSYFEYCRLGCR
jgi:hypothetical protein